LRTGRGGVVISISIGVLGETGDVGDVGGLRMEVMARSICCQLRRVGI